MAHREQERTTGQIAGQQPESVVAQIEHDTTFRQLRRELVARHNRDRTAVRRFQHRADRGTQQGLECSFRHQFVPGGEKDEVIATTGIAD